MPASRSASGTLSTTRPSSDAAVQPIRRTVMYLGETRDQATPAGSIGSLGILPPARGFRPLLLEVLEAVRFARRQLAETLDHQTDDNHHQPGTHHAQYLP